MLDRKQRRHLVVAQDDLALGIENEADVEEAILPVGMVRLGLGHDEGVVLAGERAERFGLWAGEVNCALARVLHVVEVEYLVVEGLQCALGQRDQAHRQIEAGEPGRGLAHVGHVLEVQLDIFALAYSAHRRNQPDGGVGFNHHAALLCGGLSRHAGRQSHQQPPRVSISRCETHD